MVKDYAQLMGNITRFQGIRRVMFTILLADNGVLPQVPIPLMLSDLNSLI